MNESLPDDSAPPASHWCLESEQLADYRIFRVLRKRAVSPRTGLPVVFHALDMPDWVQIIALTRSGQLVMVEQFRPGAEVNSLEFPAGVMDDHEPAERAGLRELEEETGYRGDTARCIGSVFANPAIQSNRLHIVVTENCEPTGSVQLDEGEDISVRLVDPAELPRLIADGVIHHALVLSALQFYELWRVQRSASRT